MNLYQVTTTEVIERNYFIVAESFSEVEEIFKCFHRYLKIVEIRLISNQVIASKREVVI